MLESYDIKEDTESVPMGKILALFVRATHLQSRGLLQMKVQEGFLQVFHCQSDSFFYQLTQFVNIVYTNCSKTQGSNP